MPESAWATAENIESTYIPAVSTLVKSITGCKTVLVNNVAFRRRPVNQQADPKFYHKAGGELDNLARSIPTDRYFGKPFHSFIIASTQSHCSHSLQVMPSEPSKTIEPARGMHIDYTLRGLRSTIRHCRADFASAGAAHLAALDTPDSSTRGPRVAAYSVWRPLKPVTRDPIAVLDFKTASPAHWTPFDYRSPGYQGDYLLEACAINAPEEGDERVQKWYYVSEQQPDEVMLIKFADSESEVDPKVAVGCGHGSPEVVGQYGDTRESVEARVLAFW